MLLARLFSDLSLTVEMKNFSVSSVSALPTVVDGHTGKSAIAGQFREVYHKSVQLGGHTKDETDGVLM